MSYEFFRNNGQKVLVNVQEIKQKKPEETLELVIREFSTFKHCLKKVNELSQYVDTKDEKAKYEAALSELLINHPDTYKQYLKKASEEMHNQ